MADSSARVQGVGWAAAVVFLACWATVPAAQQQGGSGNGIADSLRYEVSLDHVQPQVQGSMGATIVVECRLTNEGSQGLLVYWGDRAYNNQYLFQIQAPDGQPAHRLRERSMPPAASLSAEHFERLAPGQTLSYRVWLGSVGANAQQFLLRDSGSYYLEPSLQTWVAPADLESYLESNFQHVARNAVLTNAIEATPFTVDLDIQQPASQVGNIGIRGRVMDARSRPIQGVLVRVTQYLPSTRMPPSGSISQQHPHGSPMEIDRTFTDNNGRFAFNRLPNNAALFEVMASGDGYKEARTEIFMAPPKTSYETSLVLEADTSRITVYGSVVDRSGNPLAGVRVTNNVADVTTYTDSNGAFELKNAKLYEDGTISCGFWRRDYLRHDENVPAEVAQSGRWRIVLDTRESMLISGHAVFADAAPVANMKISFKPESTNGDTPVLLHETETEADGYFETVSTRPGLFTGYAWIKPGEGLGVHQQWRTRIEGVEPGTNDLRLVFENRGGLAVEVKPAHPLPEPRRFQVRLELPDAPSGVQPEIATESLDGAGGTIPFDKLSPGRYKVKVQIEHAESLSWSQEAAIPEDAPSTYETITFEIPELDFGGMRVRVFDRDMDTPMHPVHARLGGTMYLPKLDAVQGVIEADNLVAGSYRLSVSRDGYVREGTSFQVEAGKITELDDIVMRRVDETHGWVQGRVLYEDGPPALGAMPMQETGLGPPIQRMRRRPMVENDGKFRVQLPGGKGLVAISLDRAVRWHQRFGPVNADEARPAISDFSPQLCVLVPVNVTADVTMTRDIVLAPNTQRTIRLTGLPADPPQPKKPESGVTFVGRNALFEARVFVDAGDAFHVIRTSNAPAITPGTSSVFNRKVSYWPFRETAEGEWTLSGVPAGKVILVVRSDGFKGYKEFPADASELLFVCAASETKEITGRILGPGEEPIPDVRLTLQCPAWPTLTDFGGLEQVDGDLSHMPFLAWTETGGDGGFSLKNVGIGRYEIRAHTGSHTVSQTVEIKPGDKAPSPVTIPVEHVHQGP